MATSYANAGGTGDRTATVIVSSVGAVALDVGFHLVNGSLSDTGFYLLTTTGCSLEFIFNAKQVIDEAKWYQQTTDTHGTWKWQGSNDRATYTDLGATFTLGGATTQTQTTLAGNTTGYVFYRLLQTAGTTSSTPYIYEVEFKIEPVASTATYTHALGSGDRTATITIANSGITWSGAGQSAIVNGLPAPTPSTEAWWNGAANSGTWLSFDVGIAVILQQARVWFDLTVNQGDWKWQGSTDNSTWVDMTSTFTMSATRPDPYFIPCPTNTTGYRYYRLLGMAGSRSGLAYVREFEFMLAAAPAAPASTERAHVFVS